MSAQELAVDALAAARVTRLVTEDKITEPIRTYVQSLGVPRLEYLVSCQACVSVWAGALVVSGLVPRRVKQALAVSEAVVLAKRGLDALPTRWT